MNLVLQTTGGKDEPNIVCMRKPYQTSHNGPMNIKTYDRTNTT